RSAGGLRHDRGRLERRSRPGAVVHVVRLCDVSVRMTHFRVNATASRTRADTGNFGRVVGDDPGRLNSSTRAASPPRTSTPSFSPSSTSPSRTPTDSDGAAPDLLTTRQLAVKIVELYWPHTRPWATAALRQSSGPGGGQAEIVAAIERFRAAAASHGSTPLAEALAPAPARYRRLLDFVEWKLIEMPLPRLQTISD